MADVTEEVPYQSLYRRFRPSTFAEVRGQDHVVLALRNAVRDGRVAHAYLFSGPRGTGKTSTARILAKALNCTDLHDGEPCGVCSSCVEITRGTSLDVHELDAASNNGVDAIRDLVSRAALGSPGRQKVYIVDEVHMLSTAASNALLKTLEEPPAHVIFVLATTDPQKVLPTIRSRTQHFEFRLLGPDTLSELLAQVRTDAHLDVGDDALDIAVRRGRGSARDALSILDQVAASDAVDDDLPELDEVVESLAERDVERALVAVAHLTAAGFSPQQLTVDLVDHLRQGFLALVAPELVTVAGAERDVLAAQAARVGLATLVRAMEDLGRAQVGMRDAPDPRVNLEVALVRLVHPEADDSPAALLARIERLEASTVAGTGDATRAASRTDPDRQRFPDRRRTGRTGRSGAHRPCDPGSGPAGGAARAPRPGGGGWRTATTGTDRVPPHARCPSTAVRIHRNRHRWTRRRRPGPSPTSRSIRRSRRCRWPTRRRSRRRPSRRRRHPSPVGTSWSRPGATTSSGDSAPRPRRSTRPVASSRPTGSGPSSGCPTRSTATGARTCGPRSRPPWPTSSADPSPWSWWSTECPPHRRRPTSGGPTGGPTGGPGAPPADAAAPADDGGDLADFDADNLEVVEIDNSAEARLLQAFPGAEEVV